MSTNILMTLPKYVSIPNNNGMPLSSPVPVDELMECGKKRRLDHLTWEEKLQRKKLKNRVAAQTSRDRKKAKMDEMDLTIKQLTDENEELKAQFEQLTADNEALLKHNIALQRNLNELRSRIEMDIDIDATTGVKIETIDPATNVCEPEQHWIGCGIKTGSAVSSKINPLPKELKPQSMQCQRNTLNDYVPVHQTLTPPSTPPPAHQSIPFELNKRPITGKRQQHYQQQQQQPEPSHTSEDVPMNLKNNSDSAALWKIIALCLLYRTCSKISTQAVWKNWPKVYSQMSQQTLKMMLLKAATELPKLKANQSQCLDQWWGPKQKGWNPAKIPTEA